MIDKVIEIKLNPADRVVTRPVHQWDIGQIIKVTDAEIEDGTPVDFGNRFMKGGLRAYMLGNEVTIPAPALQQERDLTAYVVITDENSETTVKEIFIPVIPRPKPEDYVDEEIRESTEFQYVILTAEEVEANAKAAAESAEKAAESETAAGNSATAAGNAATAAAGSAASAGGSAKAAEASEKTASDKATEAGNSAEAAQKAKEAAEKALGEVGDTVEAALTEAKESGEFDGKDGKDGTDGTSVTVLSVDESTEDDGNNIVTFSDGKTLNVKNGSKGRDGDAGYTPVKGTDYHDGEDGYTPVKGVDYWTEEEQTALQDEANTIIATELAKRDQLEPLYANSIEECTDTTKLYVLPDGFIYAYISTETTTEDTLNFTNQLPLAINSDGSDYVGENGEDGYKTGYRISSSGTEKAATGYECTGFIPAVAGDTVRIKNISIVSDNNNYCMAYFFNGSFTKVSGAISMNSDTTVENGIYTFTVPSYDIGYFRVTLMGVSADTIITVNEEITYTSGGTTIGYQWANTGHAFVPADYEDRILALEEQVAINISDIEELKTIIDTPDADALELIKTWDTPIYDANIPVFQLTTEKSAVEDSEKSVSAVYAKYDALMAKHPEYITKTNLGVCSDGVTHVYRYDFREPEPHRGVTGAKEWSETKAKAIIISGVHWEWGGIFALYNALEEIADNPELFDLRRNTHLIVLPVCNPYAVANMSVRNANQVEIHRNFEVDFIYPGESGYIELGERSHGGTEPLSEVETQYIDNIMKENTDAAFFLTCHSYQSDSLWGTGFMWASPATYYMCNMAYRVVDKLSNAWMNRYGDILANGIEDYKTENLADGDTRLGSAYLSTTNGTETKQATKYGIQGINLEVCDTFWVHGTTENPEDTLSEFTMSRGAEAYINLFLTVFGVYDHKDKKEYTV